jgi:hypothetical protein
MTVRRVVLFQFQRVALKIHLPCVLFRIPVTVLRIAVEIRR